MKVWQIHSGPYETDDDSDTWVLVAKAEEDGAMKDVEITFDSLDAAYKFKGEVDGAFEPVEILQEIAQ